MRLIDADGLVKYKVTGEIGNLSGDFIPGYAIGTAPTVDAVEVVRCKDCRHRYDSEHCPMCQEHDYRDEDGDCDYYTVDRTTDNGFCHLAERMEEHATD